MTVSVLGTGTSLPYTPDELDADAEVYAQVADPTGTVETVRGRVTAGGVVGKLAAAAGRYRHLTPKATRSTLGANLTAASNLFDGGVLAPTGKIYAAPRQAMDFLIIDSINGTATRSNLGADLSATGTEKWGYGGVLGVDGRIYFCPRDASDVLIVDPATETVSRTDYGLNLSQTGKWRGGVSHPNGKIVFTPRDATDLLIIDVPSQTAIRSNLGADLTGNNKWMSGTLAPNGLIYCAPIGSTTILVVDLVNMTAVRSTFGLDLTSGSGVGRPWTGSRIGPDGKIYGVPNGATDILIIDPQGGGPLGTATRSSMGATISPALNKWSGSVLGPDGRIYCVPFDGAETRMLIIDPLGGTAHVSEMDYGQFEGSAKWVGAIQGFDGRMYGFPRSVPDLLVIDTGAPPLPPAVLLSPYLNNF